MENKTAEQIIDDISFQMFKTDYKYIGLAPCKVMVLEEYITKHASIRSKELQEERDKYYFLYEDYSGEVDELQNHRKNLESTIELQRKQIGESLEAYNRECKRVDELTEEVAKKQELILELEKELAQWRKGPHLTPDGAQSYIRCANERADKIAELEGLLKEDYIGFTSLWNQMPENIIAQIGRNRIKKALKL